jgi:hypothetical protein
MTDRFKQRIKYGSDQSDSAFTLFHALNLLGEIKLPRALQTRILD